MPSPPTNLPLFTVWYAPRPSSILCVTEGIRPYARCQGNDMADKLADYAQKGGAQNEQDIAMIMDGLRATDGED